MKAEEYRATWRSYLSRCTAVCLTYFLSRGKYKRHELACFPDHLAVLIDYDLSAASRAFFRTLCDFVGHLIVILRRDLELLARCGVYNRLGQAAHLSRLLAICLARAHIITNTDRTQVGSLVPSENCD